MLFIHLTRFIHSTRFIHVTRFVHFQISSHHYRCARCDHVTTRLNRLRAHASAKHGLQDETPEMFEFVNQCKQLSGAGWRVTDRSRIMNVLGNAAVTNTQFDAIVQVLEAHLVRVADVPPITLNEPSPAETTTPPRRSTPRKDTARGLEQRGLVTRFSEAQFCQLARLYQLLQADKTDVSEAQTYASARFLHRYVTWCLTQPECEGDERRAITKSELAPRFIQHLRGVMSPYSVRNHAFAIRGFIELALAKPNEATQFQGRMRTSLRDAAHVWDALKSDTNKAARRVQNVKIRSGDVQGVPLYEICLFLNELRNNGSITEYLDQLERAPQGKGIPPGLVHAYCTILCVLACSLLFQGTRLSAAQGLTRAEVLSQSKQVMGSHIVRIASHKTARYGGPQPVCLQFVHFDLFRKFLHCKDRLGIDVAAALSTHRGTVPSAEYLFAPLNKFLSLRLGVPIKIIFNNLRKQVESSVHMIGGSERRREVEAGISVYLAHSRDVTLRHYRFLTDSYVIEQSLRLNDILAQIVAMDMAADGKAPRPLLPDSPHGTLSTHGGK